MTRLDDPMHPGEVLQELFLEPEGLTAADLARRTGIFRPRVERLLEGKASVTPQMAERLGRALDTSATMWLAMQRAHDAAQPRE